MPLIPRCSILSLVTIAWLLLWPVTASVWGSRFIASQAITLILFLVLTHGLKAWFRNHLKPVANVLGGFSEVLVFVAFLLQPVSIPGFIITSYISFVKYVLDFAFIYMEVNLLLKLVNQSGILVQKVVYDITNESSLVQGALVFATVLVYALSGYILKESLMYSSSPIHLHALLVLIITHILAGVATYFHDEGVITNCALLFLASSLLFKHSLVSSSFPSSSYDDRINNISPEPPSSSILSHLMFLPEATTGITKHSLDWTRSNYGITFWALLMIRIIASLNWIIERRSKEADDGDEGTRFDDSREKQDSSSTLITGVTGMKVIAVIVYSAQIIQRTGRHHQLFSHSYFPDSSLDLSSTFRLLQSLFISLYYWFSLSGEGREELFSSFSS